MMFSRPVYRHADLRRTLAPESLAVVGVSTNTAALGASTWDNLKHFPGRIYAVNPRYQEFDGRPCYPRISALPEVPDCVVLAVARTQVEPVVRECAELGVGGVVIFASGYGETGRPDRIEEQARLAAIARETGLRIVGPNCIGVMNYANSLPITFTRGFDCPKPGAIAVGVASQSGAMGNAVAQASHMGLSFSHLLAAGNSVDVDTADYVAYLAEDPSCSVVVCIFEGLSDPARLIEAGEIAKSQGKPLIVFKIATGEHGAAAALSHTGTLAGSQAAYGAVFERMEAIVVTEFEAIAETAAFFAKAKRPKGQGVAIVGGSGGFCVLGVDTAQERGVPLPKPNDAVSAALRPLVPEFGVVGNPCDVTAQNTPQTFGDATAAFLADPAYGAVVLPYGFTYAGEARIRRLLGMHEAAKKFDKIACLPWMTAWAGGPGQLEASSASHLAVFGSMDRCFRTLAAWYKRENQIVSRESLRDSGRLTNPDSGRAAKRALAECAGRTVTEGDAKRILATYGVSGVPERLAQSEDEASAAAAELGYPVVLKLESQDVLHKTDVGVVRLSLAGETDVRRAYGEIMDTARSLSPVPRINGVLVQRMIPRGVELMIGAKFDPLFGPLIMLGIGGTLVEYLGDVVTDLAPVSVGRAAAMIERLRGRKLLEGYRGAAPVDVRALAEVLCRVSEFAADMGDGFAELDINPLICEGNRMVAVDALIVKAEVAERYPVK